MPISGPPAHGRAFAALPAGCGLIASRPVLLYSRFATCMQPRLNGLTTMTNSRFDGWRMENVSLDK